MKKTLLALCIGTLFAYGRAGAADPAPTPVASGSTTADPAAAGATASPGANTAADADGSTTLNTISVVGQLDQARNSLSPDTGSSQYVLSKQAIQQLPLGDSTPLNQVLLQIPGVVQDSFGQLHVRGDHANLQYRINGVILPESITGFGQTLDARVIDNLKFLTGALPAQYGYRTAGVVEITTKSGTEGSGGSVSLNGGSFGTLNPGVELYGTDDRFSYYLTANYLQNDVGIENPTDSRTPIHDHTNQLKTFGILSWLLSDTARVSFMFGSTNNRFEIPNNPNQTPNWTLGNLPPLDSADLNERQNEVTRFGVASLQGRIGNSDYQVSLFQRYTSTNFLPDFIGDLQYTGIAGTIGRSNRANGIQADVSTPLTDTHTLRYGLYVSNEHAVSSNNAWVFPVDSAGAQTGTTPFNILDDSRVVGRQYSLYVQDEWQASDKLTLNYGLRGDRVNTYIAEGQMSPRLGAVYQWSDNTTLHAGYARYFTPPPTELIAPKDLALFLGTSNAPNSLQNDPVRSQREDYLDVGISQQVGRHLTLGLDGYYRRSRNLIDEGQFGSALVFSPFNYARGRIHGVEFTAAYSKGPLNAWFNLAANRASGKDIVSSQYFFDQEELDYIANHYIHLDHDQKLASSGGINYALSDATRIGADYIFGTGLRRGFANTEHLPAYFQLNLDVSHTFTFDSIGKIDARIAVINLFDRVYELRDGSGVGVGAPQFGPRRGVYAGFTKNF